MVCRTVLQISVLMSLILLTSACGTPATPTPDAGESPPDSGSPLAESVSITVGAGAADNNTTAAAVAGTYFTVQNGSIPAASTAVTVSGGSGPSTLIRFNGKATGTFRCSDATAAVSYTDSTGQLHVAAQNVTGTSCEVTVSEYGAVGSAIRGTLTATANKFSGGAPSAATASLTGSFSVAREADK